MRKRAQLLSSMDSPPPEKRARPLVDGGGAMGAGDDGGLCSGIRRRISTAAAAVRRWWRSRSQSDVTTLAFPENNDNERHVRRGYALLINHYEFNDPKATPTRKGTIQDAEGLEVVLKGLGFQVDTLLDGSARKVLDKVDTAVATVEQGNFDCVLVVVMTHGHAGGILHAKDRQYIVQDVWTPFLASTSLNLMPKIFIFQACRGHSMDPGLVLEIGAVQSPSSASHHECGPSTACSAEIDNPREGSARPPHVSENVVCDSPRKTTRENVTVEADSTKAKMSQIVSVGHPKHYDVLVAYSTIEDYVSWRDPEDGTFYVQSLCSELQKVVSQPSPQGCNLMGLLERVHHLVGEKTAKPEKPDEEFKQAPYVSSSLTYKLFLHEQKK